MRIQELDAGDNADIVQKRRKCIERIPLTHLGNCGEDIGKTKQDRLKQHNSRNKNELVRRDAGIFRENFGENKRGKQRRDGRDNDGKDGESDDNRINVSLLFIACAFREFRDKHVYGDQGAGRDENEIGNPESRIIYIERR